MPNRYICSVFDEIRTAIKTLRIDMIPGLIEEAQVLANRMEASLYDKRDIETYSEGIRDLKAELKELRKEKRKLTGEKSKGSIFDDCDE